MSVTYLRLSAWSISCHPDPSTQGTSEDFIADAYQVLQICASGRLHARCDCWDEENLAESLKNSSCWQSLHI